MDRDGRVHCALSVQNGTVLVYTTHLRDTKMTLTLRSGERMKKTLTCPCIAADLPAMHSIIMAIVMREGKPCGLKMMSGMRPLDVQGMSSQGHFWLQIPF